MFIGEKHKQMLIKVGDKAPAFKLFDTQKTEVELSSFLGKNVVILFFPQAFTGTCTAELCSIRDNMNMYSSLNAEILAISVDSVFTLAKFKEVEGYNFTLLSDFNKETSRAYHTIYEDWILNMKGVSKRSAFVVDKKGILQYVEVLEVASELPDFEKIKKVLDQQQ